MKRIEHSSIFETVTIAKEDQMEWSDFLERVRRMVESQQIRVVDVRRQGNKLTITFRRLT